MSDFVGIDTITLLKDIGRVDKKLNRLVSLVPDAVVDAVNPYIVEVMKQYQPYRKITRKQAFGKSFQSEKQRKWFFWRFRFVIAYDQPFYRRTQGMRNAWKIIGKGQKSIIVNETEAAYYTMGDDSQDRLHTLMGWQTVGARLKLESTRKGITRAAIIGTRKAIKQAGLA